MRNKLKFYLLVLFFFVSLISYSQLNTVNYRKISDDTFFKIKGKECPLLECLPVEDEGCVVAYVFNYVNGGFVIVDSRIDASIIGFSDKGKFKIKDNPLLQYIVGGIKQQKLEGDSQPKATKRKVSSLKTEVVVEPLLSDVWGGVNCKDENGQSINATNLYTPQNCSPGCVAISSSQIFNYYKWPRKGMGNHVYTSNYDGVPYTHSAFFDNTDYDWTNIKDEYYGVPSTTVERQAVSELIYKTAVSIQMIFGPTGSTSNINKIPFVLENFFRYSGHYKESSWSSFWSRMYENITDFKPVVIGLKASRTGAQHAAVIDGYKKIDNKPYYHINWGWYNNNDINGFYNVQGWTSSSSGYNMLTGAIFDFNPTPEITDVTYDGNQNISISWDVSQKVNWDAFELEMKKDNGDWQVISSNITSKSYSIIADPAVDVYQFRVRTKISNVFYLNSWSNEYAFTNEGKLDGYISLGGGQYAYARQTPDCSLDFSGDYTFELWINVKDNNQNNDVVLYQQGAFTLGIDNISATSYAIEFISHNSGAYIKSFNSNLLLNNWVHIAVSHSNNNTKIFVNGVKDIENNSSDFNLSQSNKALNLGEKYMDSYSHFIIADIDQLRISNVDRYADSFTPVRGDINQVDDNVIGLFNCNQPHKVRLKDEAYNLSFIVKNEADGVEWKGYIIENDFAPVITQNQSTSVDVNSPNGTKVYTVTATDDDGFSSILQDWSIISGNINDAFAVNSSTGEIIINNSEALGENANLVYNLILTVSDGQYISESENIEILVEGDIILGISDTVDIDSLSVNISPNPTVDFVEVKSGHFNLLKNIKIYDSRGLLKKMISVNSETCRVDLTGLYPGIYLFCIQSEDKQVVKRIIKK